MRHSQSSGGALRAFWLAVIPSVVLAGTPVLAQTVVPLAPFHSVTLREGGRVILRHAASQRVTLLEGSAATTRLTVAEGGRLMIDRCRGECPEGYDLAIEVLSPDIVDVRVMDGGTIRSVGFFPRQAEIGVGVEQGGIVDLRSMTVDVVAAQVHEGGRIFTKPQGRLVAKISGGGVVTYWGHPRVTSSIVQGGVVARGAAADADKPLSEFDPAILDVPPIPPIPPIPPLPSDRGGS